VFGQASIGWSTIVAIQNPVQTRPQAAAGMNVELDPFHLGLRYLGLILFLDPSLL